jgi:hypothetical protein
MLPRKACVPLCVSLSGTVFVRNFGAGDGIRTYDPNLGKVGEFNFSGLPLISTYTSAVENTAFSGCIVC